MESNDRATQQCRGNSVILWPDAGAGNDRFHFDSRTLEPLEVEWSHNGSRSVDTVITPDDSTRVVVPATRGGREVEASMEIRVRRTFEEWLAWKGIPQGQVDDALLPAYALGGRPDQPVAPVLDGGEVSWPKNPRAMGTWWVQSSRDLLEWEDERPSGDFQMVEDTDDRVRVRISMQEPRIFLRLVFSPDGV